MENKKGKTEKIFDSVKELRKYFFRVLYSGRAKAGSFALPRICSA
jgi:hypothetical protein